MKKTGIKRRLTGIVVSDKMEKTVIVQVERIVKHPIYKKYVRKRSKFAAHDEHKTCNIGDKVSIIECRPLSRTKRWRVSLVVEKAV